MKRATLALLPFLQRGTSSRRCNSVLFNSGRSVLWAERVGLPRSKYPGPN